jgi:RNA polymerase sigma factor (sigma-70 family)
VDSDIEDEGILVHVDMDESLVRQQAGDVLREAIAALTDDQQQVIILRFVEGHRIEAVATLLNKNANAIKALQHRALRSLAARLERSGLDLESIIAGLSS